MKRMTTVCGFFLLLPLVGLLGNTVMISVQESGDRETEVFLSAVESGIMDEFFEAGDIVFNDIQRDPGKTPGIQREILLAREGGADRLLKVTLRFNRNSEVPGDPESLIYTYVNLADRHIIKEESLSAKIIEKDPKMPNEEFCLLLGREIGKRILRLR